MRHHSIPLDQQHNDAVHDEVKDVLEDICAFIDPLLVEWRWVLFIDPGTKEFKYWQGNMEDTEFQNLVEIRLDRAMAKMPAQERREYCDHMIAMWTKWRDRIK